jgi:hypothetical protein
MTDWGEAEFIGKLIADFQEAPVLNARRLKFGPE